MTYEQGGEEHYEFSPEQIEPLVDKSRAFHSRYAQPESLEHIEMGAYGGPLFTVWSTDMPHFRLDSRDISVIAQEGDDDVTIHLLDFLSELDQPIVVGRSLFLNLRLLFGTIIEKGSPVTISLSDSENPHTGSSNPLLHIDPTKDILVNYSEFPTTRDRTLLTRDQYTDQTPNPVNRFRRFTKGDYDDMMQMLDAGLEA